MIIGVGERLHKVLWQIGSELWFPWQPKVPKGFHIQPDQSIKIALEELAFERWNCLLKKVLMG